MLRGFATTLAVVSAVTLVAWAYTDQARMARATTAAEMTPVTSSATTNSNLAAKGDRLSVGVRLSGVASADGAMDRIMEAHARAMAENASDRFMTVSVPSGHDETTLVRVPVRD
ncbi:hypothetical protein [Flaviflagellibacter deserti]|uniref:Secreted protein n=1 Tax=Flaviflagellibacter deserti TaxID=2267266 RepID=A0ABV9Z3Y1_9HYPH